MGTDKTHPSLVEKYKYKNIKSPDDDRKRTGKLDRYLIE